MKLLVFGILLAQGLYETDRPLEEMRDTQVVLVTSRGTIVLDLLPDEAPNHVGYFLKMAEEGAYDGTTFHRVIRHGIIQGGDPETKDPDATERYGTGGLGVLAREPSDEKHTRGAVSAVQIPGKPDSAGSQFFIVVTDQPSLDGQYTVFARVAEGMSIAQSISEIEADENGNALERVEIADVTIRDRPPPEIPPFSTETVEELAAYGAVLETSMGEIEVELFPELAPTHVRNFLRLAEVGAYDGLSFHRVVPGFVIQTGFLATRAEPPSERIMKYVGTLEPEFNDTPHVPGVLSMAHGEDPASASTSFFIVTGIAPALDNEYTALGRVVSGMDVVEAIEAVPLDGEEPVDRVELVTVRVKKVAP